MSHASIGRFFTTSATWEADGLLLSNKKETNSGRFNRHITKTLCCMEEDTHTQYMLYDSNYMKVQKQAKLSYGDKSSEFVASGKKQEWETDWTGARRNFKKI